MQFNIPSAEEFFNKLLTWADTFEVFCCLNNNHFKTPYHSYNIIVAIGMQNYFDATDHQHHLFTDLKHFLSQQTHTVFGHLGYDLKNHIEDLSSQHIDFIKFQDIFLFTPEIVIELSDDNVHIQCLNNTYTEQIIYQSILNIPCTTTKILETHIIQQRFSKNQQKTSNRSKKL